MVEPTLFEELKKPETTIEPGMGLQVKTAAGWLKGFFFLFGSYVTFHGHRAPGGGFDGGIIVACTFILLMLAYGSRHALAKLGKMVAWKLQGAGALAFLALAGAGAVTIPPTDTTARAMLFDAGIAPWLNAAIAMTVGSSLFMVFIILAVVRVREIGGQRTLVNNEGTRQ